MFARLSDYVVAISPAKCYIEGGGGNGELPPSPILLGTHNKCSSSLLGLMQSAASVCLPETEYCRFPKTLDASSAMLE